MSKKLDDLHEHIERYLSTYRQNKGTNPPCIRLTAQQIKILEKEAPHYLNGIDGIPLEVI
jgi:hypothetical protein